MPKVSVLVPSRLQKNLVARKEAGDLLLDRSVMSVVRNAREADVELEVLVGLDADHAPIPERFTQPDDKVLRFAVGGHSQAEAVNAAAKLITGDLVAFCEEDDVWQPGKLAIQMKVLAAGYDFVSCTQREGDEMQNFLRYNCFPTPSGWLMKREVWEKVGGFDETFRYHVDTEWLGRLYTGGFKRCHIAHVGSDKDPWLEHVNKYSAIMTDDELTDPLVARMVNEHGGMSAIMKDAERLKALFCEQKPRQAYAGGDEEFVKAYADFIGDQADEAGDHPTPYIRSVLEHRIIFDRYGNVPW